MEPLTLPTTMTSLSQLMLQSHRHSPVSVDPSGNTSWAQFTHDVTLICQTLAHYDAKQWAICCEDSYFFAVAFMALAHSKHQLVLPGNHQPAALAELSHHFDGLLHDNNIQCPSDCISLKLNDIDWLASVNNAAPFTPLALEAIELTLFTSGSSGTPKAIHKNLALLNNEITQLESLWGERLAQATISSTVSHQHIYGLLFRILWPLCCDRSFSRFDLIYPEQVMAQANNDHVLISSPALLKRLDNEQKTEPYRAIFSSGGPLPLAAAHQCQHLFEQLPFEVFGSTETGGMAYRQQQQATTPWQRFPAIDIALNAEQCLKILSPFIDQTQWYQTSDHCELIDNDRFMLKGRTDRIIKIEEKRISLTDVEQRLCSLPWIDEAAVLPLEQDNRLILGAVITLTNEGHKQIALMGKGKFWLLLRQQLRQWIEPVGIPRSYRLVDSIPLNTQGKRLVSDLEQLFKADNA
ncbi:AMP-binding protein [Photobacterium leiognathi]|uniref:AMP-binding protein n=1 Tax=Photobacterium leiognathi TaxID=553611 RepID=UPI002981F65A|nr:AMP-binding protein [Photobacterium leiognathi]